MKRPRRRQEAGPGRRQTMKTEKRRIAAMLALVFSLALAFTWPGVAHAEISSGTVNHFNVVLVVDKSGSLGMKPGSGTDPQGLRFDAMRLFLGLLTETGNNVGAVVFDEQIRFESGMRAMDGMESKQALIREVESYAPSYDTDIGSAVLRATEMLKGMREENGLPCMILLLSDGKTDFPDRWVRKLDSWQLAAQALEAAREEGITINGILLNVDGIAEGGEIELGLYTTRTNGSFEEVTRPEDLTGAFKRFYTMINNAEYSGTDKVAFSENGEAEKTFIVPGFGVEEVNIIIEHESDKGAALNDLVDITVIQPDGSVFDTTGHELLSSRYMLAKIPHPTLGVWNVSLKGDPGDTVDITMVFNASMSVSLEAETTSGTGRVYKPYRYKARVTDPSVETITDEQLRTLTAVLEIEEKGTGHLWQYPMEVEDGCYVGEAPFSKGGDFTVSALVGVEGFEVRSNPIEITVEVRPLNPKIWSVEDMLSMGRFVDDHWELELDELFGVTREVALDYTLSDDYDGALTVVDGVLQARFRGTERADFVLTAADAFGQSAELPFNFPVPSVAATTKEIKNMTQSGQFGDGYWEIALDKLFSDPKGCALDYALSDDFDGALTIADGMLRMDIQKLREANFTLTATDIFDLRAEIPFRVKLPAPTPTSSGFTETVKTGWFQEGVWEKSINSLFKEPKGTPLTYSLTDDLGGKAVIEDGVLRVKCRGIGKAASFKLVATDAYELSAEIPVTLTEKYVTPYYLLQGAIVLLALASLVSIIIYLRRRY